MFDRVPNTPSFGFEKWGVECHADQKRQKLDGNLFFI